MGPGRRRGHHPAPHRMPFNKRSFFLAATAIELSLFPGDSRSQYTGNCTNVINTTAGAVVGRGGGRRLRRRGRTATAAMGSDGDGGDGGR